MREEQHPIDQLFQSKLEGMELTPTDRVWSNIEASMKQDDKKPLIPFYFRHIALVASLVIGSFLLGYYFSETGALSNYKHNIAAKDKGVLVNPSTEVSENISATQVELNPIAPTRQGKTKSNNKSTETAITAAASGRAANTSQSLIAVQKALKQSDITTEAAVSAQDLVPSFEWDKKKRKIARYHQSVKRPAPAFATSKDEENTPEAAVAKVSKAKLSADKITILRNNETIVLEIIGDKKVSVENPAEPRASEDKLAEVDFKAIKKAKGTNKGFFIGTNMGLNLSTLYFSERSTDPIFNNLCSFRTIPGYLFGVSAGYEFNNRWGLQLGVNFSRYNYGFTQPENDYVNRGELSVFQLDIPILLRYKWNFEVGKKRNLFSLVAQAGLKYSYITKYYLAARLFSNDAKNVAFWHMDKINHDENHQLGYLAGVEANYYLTRNIYLFGAVSGTVASDITQFPIFLNNQLEKPTQLSGNVLFGVRYLFNKKKKTTK